MSGSGESVAEYAVYGRRRAVPLLYLGIELFAPFSRDPVIARLPIVLAHAPLGANPAAAQHRLQRRIERPLVHVEDVARDLAEPEREPPAVHRLFAEQLESEHFEGPAHDFGARSESGFSRHGPLDYQKGKMVGQGGTTNRADARRRDCQTARLPEGATAEARNGQRRRETQSRTAQQILRRLAFLVVATFGNRAVRH